jgi:hypothetical protein
MKEGHTWLTVPVKTKSKFGDLPIDKLEIANDTQPRWAQKHWLAIQSHYGKAAYFPQHTSYFQELYSQHWDYLIDIVRNSTGHLLDILAIRTPLLFSSQMDVTGKKDDLILNLCRAVGATHYMSGPLGRNYIREQPFREAGIGLTYHDYNHPQYPQAYPGFEPYMSTVDLLFNCGSDSLNIIMSGNVTKAEIEALNKV